MARGDFVVYVFNDARVLARAREIVKHPITKFGYSDIGDQIVEYLRGSKNADEVITSMDNLEKDYIKVRGK